MKRLISSVLTLIIMISLFPITTLTADNKMNIEGNPSGITVTGEGNFLVTDIWDMAVWEIDKETSKKLTKSGARDMLGKVIGDMKDGFIGDASFSTPFAIVPYLDGYAVSDTDNHLIRFISGDKSKVSTIAGNGQKGLNNGKGAAASFNRPTGLASDLAGNLYIADTDNNVIRKMDKDGNVTTFAGGIEGYTVGSLDNTRFSMPTGLCWYDGRLYIADSGNHRIVVIKGDASSVLTGGVKNRNDEEELNGGSYLDGSVEAAGFSTPQGVLAGFDCIYIADTGNGVVRKVADGKVTTLSSPRILSPRSMALVDNTLYVCDTNSNNIIEIIDNPDVYLYADTDLLWLSISKDMYRYDVARNIYKHGIVDDMYRYNTARNIYRYGISK